MASNIDLYINDSIEGSIGVKSKILQDNTLLLAIQSAANLCIEAFNRGNKVILAGNGGSAADAQHIAAEFVSRFEFDRPGLPSIALTTDTSMLTAIGNDYGYEKLFLRQLQANAKEGDIFIAITTSGNSENIVEAVKGAVDLGVTTIGLTGEAGILKDLTDFCICVPSDSTPRIQESHILIGHIICGIVEKTIFAGFAT